MQVLTLNKIAECGLNELTAFEVVNESANPDAVILRSFSMHEMELPKSLLAVARAGAGVNNIPIDKCTEQGVVVFNTPGANANAVKELVIAGLLLSSRRIVDGVNWAQSLNGQEGVAKLVEKGKADFVGPEILGKKLGVIGLGAIGVLVANSCAALGMDVLGYDPYISVDAAWGLSVNVQKAGSLDAILDQCDYISIHVPLIDETKKMFNTERLAKLKPGARILNFARAELVDNAAMKAAIENGTVACYVTDFPTDDVLGNKNIITIPHLGASTPESEDNCATMAAIQLRNYLLYGSIKNSVNFPNCELDYSGRKRLCVIHKNVPHVVSDISTIIAGRNINIDDMISKSKGDYAYAIIDGDKVDEVVDDVRKIEAVISVRVI